MSASLCRLQISWRGEERREEESGGTIIPTAATERERERRVTDFGIRQIPFKSRHFLSKTRRRDGETVQREQGGLILSSWKTWKKFQPPRVGTEKRDWEGDSRELVEAIRGTDTHRRCDWLFFFIPPSVES